MIFFQLLPALLSPVPTLAATGGVAIDQLKQLLNQGEFASAWQQAQALRAEWEGDAEFDYLYGRLAYESSLYNEALFAFERVLIAQPLHHRARLELARAYFALGDVDRASAELKQVLDINPPQAVRDNIAAFQREIDFFRRQRQTQWLPRVGAQLGSDSNINSATADDSIVIPLFGQLLLSDDAREIDDNFSQLDAGLSWLHPFSKRQQLLADAQVTQKSFQNFDQYDQTTGNVTLGYRHRVRGSEYSTALRYQSITLDSEQFQNSANISVGWQHMSAQSYLLGANLSYSDIRYADDEFRDVSQTVVALVGGERQGRWHNVVTVLYGDESTRLSTFPHNAKQFSGLIYQGTWLLSAKQQINWQLLAQDMEYKSAHPMSLTGDAREDTTAMLSLGWHWQLSAPVQVQISADYTSNNSNLSLFDYDRTAVAIGARYVFR